MLHLQAFCGSENGGCTDEVHEMWLKPLEKADDLSQSKNKEVEKLCNVSPVFTGMCEG